MLCRKYVACLKMWPTLRRRVKIDAHISIKHVFHISVVCCSIGPYNKCSLFNWFYSHVTYSLILVSAVSKISIHFRSGGRREKKCRKFNNCIEILAWLLCVYINLKHIYTANKSDYQRVSNKMLMLMPLKKMSIWCLKCTCRWNEIQKHCSIEYRVCVCWV